MPETHTWETKQYGLSRSQLIRLEVARLLVGDDVRSIDDLVNDTKRLSHVVEFGCEPPEAPPPKLP